MRTARRAVSVVALALSGVALLPALFLATYDHQGGSPIEGWQLAQFALVATAFALALWGHLSDLIAPTIVSVFVVAGWVLLGFAVGE